MRFHISHAHTWVDVPFSLIKNAQGMNDSRNKGRATETINASSHAQCGCVDAVGPCWRDSESARAQIFALARPARL